MRVFDLSKKDTNDIKGSLITCLSLLSMKFSSRDIKAHIKMLIATLKKFPNYDFSDVFKNLTIIVMYLYEVHPKADNAGEDELVTYLKNRKNTIGDKVMTTLKEFYVNEGREDGILIGEKRGERTKSIEIARNL